MNKQLKLFNGSARDCRDYNDSRWDCVACNGDPHAYVAAYSIADMARMIEEYTGHKPSMNQLRTYWNRGRWGIHMDGATPERGIWIRFDDNERPVRVWPREESKVTT
jgi:hypothetical protein